MYSVLDFFKKTLNKNEKQEKESEPEPEPVKDVRTNLVDRVMSFNNLPDIESRKKIFLERLKNNPYYAKYVAKMNKLSDEEINARIEKLYKDEVNGSSDISYFSSLQSKNSCKDKFIMHPKHLKDIMHLEKIEHKDASEITKIWEKYHEKKNVVYGTITQNRYKNLLKQSEVYNTFLLPLPKSQGFEFFLMQFSENTVHFTSLLNYQLNKENAEECLIIVFYPELEDKGLVLMRGHFNDTVVTFAEANCLTNQLLIVYGQTKRNNIELLESFSKNLDSFDHNKFIQKFYKLYFN